MWLALLSVAIVSAAPVQAGKCQSAPAGRIVSNKAGQPIYVRTIGSGRPILMIPSLARGVDDFVDLARRLETAGFETILPDPRATGRSTFTPAKDLFDLADDDLAVIQSLCEGRVVVLGHAFGNRVARSLASEAPARVSDVVLLAGGGEVPPTPRTSSALQGALSEGSKPDVERLKDLKIAFFAKGQDASVWLKGWYPSAANLQRRAGIATPVDRWWKAGAAPVLLLQAVEDPVAPPENASSLKRDLGDRLTIVELPHASHAILPEQPKAVAAVIAAYLNGVITVDQLNAVVARTVEIPYPPDL